MLDALASLPYPEAAMARAMDLTLHLVRSCA